MIVEQNVVFYSSVVNRECAKERKSRRKKERERETEKRTERARDHGGLRFCILMN